MSAHTELSSREDFDRALQTPDKFVFIYAYEGEVSPQAEEYAKKFSNTTVAYKVDVGKQVRARDNMGVSTFPAAIVYKDGEQVRKVEGMDPVGMRDIAQLLA